MYNNNNDNNDMSTATTATTTAAATTTTTNNNDRPSSWEATAWSWTGGACMRDFPFHGISPL